MSQVRDLVGQAFGELKVIERATSNRQGRAQWKAVCSCGGHTISCGSDLVRGKIVSCGCVGRNNAANSHSQTHAAHRAKFQIPAVKHHVPEHWVWDSMKSRCLNQRNRSFQDYGGRGITVCERWRESFENFWEDMGPRPTPQHSIDRINNDGNYEKTNCRWATRTEQANNRRAKRLRRAV